MLETLRQKIEAARSVNFEEYFAQYVMSVQDRNIELELKYLLKHNSLKADSIGYLIQNTYEGLREIYDYNSSILTESVH